MVSRTYDQAVLTSTANYGKWIPVKAFF